MKSYVIKKEKEDKIKEIFIKWKNETFIEIDDLHRLYYKIKDDSPGFTFCAFVLNSWSDDIPWNEDSDFDIILHGEALFDGLRHTNFGGYDDGGYIYYPDSAGMAGIMAALWMLEQKYCWEGMLEEQTDLWGLLTKLKLQLS